MTGPEQRAGRALSSATQQLVGELDDVWWAMFQAIDEMQRTTVDLSLDWMTLDVRASDGLAALARAACGQLADARRVYGSIDGLRLGYRELLNKIDVFDLVKHVRRVLGPGPASEDRVPALIDAAYALPPFSRIWAIEGLGHDYADWASAHTGTARLLATDGSLREGALPMLHAGLGLSLADALLRTATPFDGHAAFCALVETFRDRCDRSARAGYAGCAYESLGLVTRTVAFPSLHHVDRALIAAAPALRPYFWHGVGRALYFSPLHFIPGVASPWSALDIEPPDDLARANATAGLAWATALVNMRQPEIVAALLPDVVDSGPDNNVGCARVVDGTCRDRAIANGIASTFAMALETDRDMPFVPLFTAYAPSDASERRVWAAIVPSLGAIDRARRAAKEGPGIQHLFAYSAASVDRAIARGGAA